ncbi:MAG: glycoside hydrolase family 1 protein [Cuniculiplasma sp.]|jgi:beta-galactosidase|nr:glycoside hydrolase family 1 protein [Cuniculiplasma sp.]
MFSKSFLFGFSLSGFQSEMGLSETDENSDWWKWVHDRNNVRTGIVSGDMPEEGVAYWDLYENYNRAAKNLGANAFRLGMEWTRLFPRATPEIKVDVKEENKDIKDIKVTDETLSSMDKVVNSKAVEHYRKIFKNVKDNNMSLIINVYHWPLPLELHDPILSRESGLTAEKNGWLNHKTVVEFTKYAAYVAWKFDDIADQFSIMNEPNVVFGNGYFNVKSGFPPAYPSPEAGNLSKKHIIEAIGRSYDEMKKFTKKPVGLIYANADFVPKSRDDEDAVELALFNERYSFFDSLRKGDMSWVNVVNDSPVFGEPSSEIRDDLKNKLDWIGVNYYTRNVVKKTETGYTVLKGYGHNAIAGMLSSDNREVSDFGWEVYPEGIYHVLKQYHERYHMPMIVTENGIADSYDKIRPRYLVSHLNEVERAANEGIDVRGYLHWSLLDNYEWSSGFGLKFGILGVNLKTKKIEMRPSALVFKRIAENNGVPEDLKWMA